MQHLGIIGRKKLEDLYVDIYRSHIEFSYFYIQIFDVFTEAGASEYALTELRKIYELYIDKDNKIQYNYHEFENKIQEILFNVAATQIKDESNNVTAKDNLFPSEINQYDIVCLRCATNIPMLVESIVDIFEGGKKCHCVWVDRNGVSNSVGFKSEMLELYSICTENKCTPKYLQQ